MTTQIPLHHDTGSWPKAKRPVHDWPVNEIVLQSLVLAGRTDHDIARIYGVDPDAVTTLRAKFGF